MTININKESILKGFIVAGQVAGYLNKVLATVLLALIFLDINRIGVMIADFLSNLTVSAQ